MGETYDELLAKHMPKPIAGVIAETAKKFLVSNDRRDSEAPKAVAKTESEVYWVQHFNRILKDPLVTNRSRDPAVAEPTWAGTERGAIAGWIAVHINAWLRKWPGNQHARVTRVWLEDPGRIYGYLTMVVGHDGVDDEFEVYVERLGPHSLRIVIVENVLAAEKSNMRHKLPERYTRVGQLQTSGRGYPGYATLPTGKEKGAKGGL